MIINAGIQRVVYRDGYADQLAGEMLQQAGVTSDRVAQEAP
jgi:deoxycytidylate deaminase